MARTPPQTATKEGEPEQADPEAGYRDRLAKRARGGSRESPRIRTGEDGVVAAACPGKNLPSFGKGRGREAGKAGQSGRLAGGNEGRQWIGPTMAQVMGQNAFTFRAGIGPSPEGCSILPAG
jgi:hypothetical protein